MNIKQEITSLRNERIKNLKKLKRKQFRDSTHTFFLEGTKLFEEALNCRLSFKEIFLTKGWLETYGDAFFSENEKTSLDGCAFFIITDELCKSISEMDHPEGIICVIEKPIFLESNFKTYVLLEDVQDPSNVGAIIRTADAAGINCVVTSKKSADIYNDKVLRSSMGSVFHLPIIQVDSFLDYLLTLKKNDVKIVGTSLNGNDLWSDASFTHSSFGIVFGNESKGISDAVAMLCDIQLKIPMFGKAESLNVSVAAGIIIYDLVRRNLI
ncbi:MAG: TrmH family RNA methyltransferase [Eubacteriaceae bacterium]